MKMNEQKEQPSAENRRPLASRSTSWAKFLSGALVRSGISANAISVISIVFAAMGAALLLCVPTSLGFFLAAACVQLRLLCNLLDGMVAIEGNRKAPTGALYNEIPDRIADSLFIVALGYAAGIPMVGWYGALAAAVTAYIRVLGGALGFAQDFRGPMAKQHRMAVVTLACVIGALELHFWHTRWTIVVATWIVAVGATLTCGTRAAAIARQLKSRTPQ